jgi:hypothetical protein
MDPDNFRGKDKTEGRRAGGLSRRGVLLTGSSLLAAAGLSDAVQAQAQPRTSARSANFSPEELAQRTVERRAVEAAI